MIKIEFNYYGRTVKGILLAKYQRLHQKIVTTKRKFLWITKTVDKWIKVNSPLYLVFIPWKHSEKQVVEISENDIINLNTLQLDDDWFKIDEFISEALEGVYNSDIKIKNFVGYKFVYDYNHFINNMDVHEFIYNLEVLYQNMPELATLDLDNKEE